jgi:hypothetical protein
MRRLVLCALVALTAACGDTPTIPTPPSLNPVTETFTNTLAPNGAFTNPFTAASPGMITATLTTIAPDTTVAVGFTLGTWNASTSVCSATLSNDLAIQGSALTATAQTAGLYCVRVFDVGKVTAATPTTYTVTVTHP